MAKNSNEYSAVTHFEKNACYNFMKSLLNDFSLI